MNTIRSVLRCTLVECHGEIENNTQLAIDALTMEIIQWNWYVV